MKQLFAGALCVLLLTTALPACAFGLELSLGGQPVGIELQTDGVYVAGFAEVQTEQGPCAPAREAGIREGDRVVRVGGKPVESAADFIAALSGLQGERVEIGVRRDGVIEEYGVQPVLSDEGQWMLGLWLRDQSSGIGTLTFYDPATKVYGALGHGVSDEDTGETLPIRGGQITEAQIVDVRPGSRGVPGELSGSSDPGRVLGAIEKNTETGIYGAAETALGDGSAEVGLAAPGPASILTTVEGRTARAYAAEISRVYTEGGALRMQLTVTDPQLRQLAGGIVQGMSGSPILQNGKLVGAVTHVLVSDPCRGYGIGIQAMLAEAGIAAEESAA